MSADHPTLPCYPCPHQSACCAYGTTLTDQEAESLGRRFGWEKVYRTRWGEWRTRVRNRRCAFLKDNVCQIHADPSYPAVCRGFPWIDADHGGPYEFDQTICPEFISRPDLIQLGRATVSREQAVPSGGGPDQPQII